MNQGIRREIGVQPRGIPDSRHMSVSDHPRPPVDGYSLSRYSRPGFARAGKSQMSQKHTYSIRCPKCGKEQKIDLYESINVQATPELKTKLMANELNVLTCDDCKLSFRVDKPLLYNDPAHHVMIYLIPMDEQVFDEGEREFADSLQRLTGLLPEGIDTPDVCLVFSRSELVERIFLFDAGLDERIIEYIKYMIYTNNLEKLNPKEKNLLFDAEDSTDEKLCFVVQDAPSRRLESLLHYDRKTYDALAEMFDEDEQTATLLELFPGPHVSARALFLKEPSDPGRPATP